MRIVLDTNVIHEDFLLGSSRIAILIEFARKAQARFILPTIVLKEIEGNYRRELQKRLSTLNAAQYQMKGIVNGYEPVSVAIDIDGTTKAYLTHIRKRLGISLGAESPMTESHLRDAVDRSIVRRVPCTTTGEEIRDAILWCSVLDIAKESSDTVVFISRNVKQFAKGSDLHPELQTEVTDLNVHVEYYPSVDDFNRRHAVPVEFITKKWIQQQIMGRDVLKKESHYIGAAAEELLLRHLPDDEDMTGYSAIVGGELALKEFYVHEMEAHVYRVESVWEGWIEIEYEVEVTRDHLETEWELVDDPFAVDPEYREVRRPKPRRTTETRSKELDLKAFVDTLVENEAVASWHVIDHEVFSS